MGLAAIEQRAVAMLQPRISAQDFVAGETGAELHPPGLHGRLRQPLLEPNDEGARRVPLARHQLPATRVVTRLVAEAPSRLSRGGFLVFEFGLGQDVEVEEVLDRTPDLTLLELRRDLQGIARTAIAQRR